MDSYVKLNKEINELQDELKKIEIDKINILMPLYEIEKNYKQQLGDILPRNINFVKQRNLELRISVLEEEIKDLELEYETTKDLMNKIATAKEKLEENKNDQEQTKIRITEKESKIQKRKDYVLSKIQEKEEIESEIKKLQTKIREYYVFLEKREWEAEIVNSVDRVLKRLWNELEIKSVELDKILNDKDLVEDIEELLNQIPKVETILVEDNLNEITEQPEETPKVEEENNSLLEEIKDEHASEIPEEIITINEDKTSKERFEEALFAVEELEEDNNDELAEESVHPEEDIEEEQITLNEEDQKLQNSEIEITEEVNDEEELEHVVEDVYDNSSLEEKLKAKKERITLGISTIITKLIYRPKKLVNKSNDLIKEVKNLVDNNIKKLTQEEVNDTVITASKIKHQKDQILEDEKNKEYNNYRAELKDLKNLNKKLEEELNEIYSKEEFAKQDKDNIKVKSK